MATVVETVERDGVRVLVYDNGMERNAETGHWMKAPPAAKITPENSHALARKRWEKFRAASNSRIVREAAAIDPSVRTPADAYGLLASKQFVALMDYDKPRIDELEKMGEIMAGGKMDKQDSDGSGSDTTSERRTIAAMAEIIARVMADVQRAHDRQSAEVIDGSTIPVQLRETEKDENATKVE